MWECVQIEFRKKSIIMVNTVPGIRPVKSHLFDAITPLTRVQRDVTELN